MSYANIDTQNGALFCLRRCEMQTLIFKWKRAFLQLGVNMAMLGVFYLRRWTQGQMRTDGRTDGLTDTRTDRRVHRWMDARMDGQKDRQKDRQTDR